MPDIDQSPFDRLAGRDVDDRESKRERDPRLRFRDVAAKLVTLEEEGSGRLLRGQNATDRTGGHANGPGTRFVDRFPAADRRGARK